MQTSMRINIEVLNDAALVPVIRQIVAVTLSELMASRSSIDDATLFVGEACGNVVRHAYDEPSLYEVGLEVGDGSFELEVLDYGKGFDPSSDPGFGHFGLSIMSNIDPNVRIKSTPGEGTAVYAHIPIETPSASLCEKPS